MPGLVRKLLIFAAAEGLVLQPLASRHQRGSPAVRIDYESHNIESLAKADEPLDGPLAAFESHGIIGLLSVSSSSFLISISRRRQVAQIRGKPIFVVTEVALIPLSSQAEANKVVVQTRDRLQRSVKAGVTHSTEDDDSSEDDDEDGLYDADDLTLSTGPDDVSDVITSRPSVRQHERRTSIAEDVIGRKGMYGRFAERWFSNKGWSAEKRRLQGMSTDELPENGNSPVKVKENQAVPEDESEPKASPRSETAPAIGSQLNSATSTLVPKLLRTTKMLFGSQSFFFSYDYDITRSPTSQTGLKSDLPLYRTVEDMFFWNHNVMLPFINSQQDALVLPLMQGFVGQCTFNVRKPSGKAPPRVVEAHVDVGDVIEDQNNADDSDATPGTSEVLEDDRARDFLLTLISRRSVERAGLRYLRRGIDEDGHAANTVETEQILSSPSWSPSEKLYSLVQIRGSIPLYFSQSPYSFKPVPVLQRSAEVNYTAMKRHFNNLANRYDAVQVDSLVAKHGNEAKIGEEYEKTMAKLNESGGVHGSKIGFEWFDFHEVCRGMKFENVSLLMDTLADKLTEFGNTIEVDGKIQKKQTGVLRTNCMDCLDRTNVVQSAYGRRELELQLKDQGFDLVLQVDKTTPWFNTLWADNGDAISKQYTSTAALKGDYTRTRKRDYRGALNDFGLSLSRFFNNVVNDYFSQAAIDYLLGNVNAEVFQEFEADMMSRDPAMSMSKLRQQAIDTSARIVIADKAEELLGGWTLLAPHSSNTLRSFPFTETVLLLTPAALYVCFFADAPPLEKISSFNRIPLSQIRCLHRGAYITSTLAPAHTSEARNVGFVVSYVPAGAVDVKVNTRTMSFVGTSLADEASPSTGPAGRPAQPPAPRVQAFKALPSRSSALTEPLSPDATAAPPVSEKQLVRDICAEIERAVNAAQQPALGKAKAGLVVERKDVISLAEARRSTGLLEQLGYELKKLVWA